MSYDYRILYDNPLAAWSFNGVGPTLTDISGGGRNATATAVAVDMPIVARGIGGLRLKAANCSFPVSSLMAAGTENRAFSLEAWVKPQSNSDFGWLFRRNTAGVKVTGTTISFVLPMLTPVQVDWAGVSLGSNYHVVAVYDTSAAYLYVNGLVVGSVNIDSDNLSYGFPTETNAALVMESTGAFSMVADSPALYSYALSPAQVAEHFAAGADYPSPSDISRSFPSNTFDIWGGMATVKALYDISSQDEWNTGATTGAIEVAGDSLRTTFDSSLNEYGAATWTGTFTVPSGGTIEGSQISWVASQYTGYTVDVSIDGTTWTAVTHNSQPFGSLNLSADLVIYVRVTIPAGVNQITLNELTLTIYTSKAVSSASNSSLKLSLTNPTTVTLNSTHLNPAAWDDNTGYSLLGGSSRVFIPQDTVFGGYQAVEIYAKVPNTASKNILDTSEGAAVYTDTAGHWIWSAGVAVYVDGLLLTGTPTPDPDRWHHILVVIPTTAGGIYVGNNAAANAGMPMQISFLAAHFDALTQTDVTNIYNALAGAPAQQVLDSSVVHIIEKDHPPTDTPGPQPIPFRIYTFNWAITSAG